MDALKRRVSLSPTSKNILKYHTLIYVLTAFLLYTTSYLPSFDTSAEILIPTGSRWRWEGLIFRWDMFHFSHIAQRGYEYEYEFAFFPGVPLVLNLLGRVGRWLYVRMNIDEGRVVAFGGSFIVFCISGFTALDLYQCVSLSPSFSTEPN
jgi:phosphatidylinositol glycan class V